MPLLVMNPPANAGHVRDAGSIRGWGRSPGGGHGNPLQYSFLENPMDRGAWQAIVHRVKKSWTQLKQFSTHAHLLQIFFPSLWFIFSFSWLSFAEQKFLFLVKSSWWMISLIIETLVLHLKSHCHIQSHLNFILLSTRSFTVCTLYLGLWSTLC